MSTKMHRVKDDNNNDNNTTC